MAGPLDETWPYHKEILPASYAWESPRACHGSPSLPTYLVRRCRSLHACEPISWVETSNSTWFLFLGHVAMKRRLLHSVGVAPVGPRARSRGELKIWRCGLSFRSWGIPPMGLMRVSDTAFGTLDSGSCSLAVFGIPLAIGGCATSGQHGEGRRPHPGTQTRSNVIGGPELPGSTHNKPHLLVYG